MPPPLTNQQIAEFRLRLCEIAESQFAERGIERVSMRSLAEALGCSATALYSYFENKDAILAAVRTNALDRLSVQIEAAMASSTDLWEQSRAIGAAYIRFAFAEPQAYQLIFALDQPELEGYPDLARAHERSHRTLVGYVENMVAAGLLIGDPVLIAHVFWAGMHGLIVLQMAGKLGNNRPDFETLRHEMMRLITRGATPFDNAPSHPPPTENTP